MPAMGPCQAQMVLDLAHSLCGHDSHALWQEGPEKAQRCEIWKCEEAGVQTRFQVDRTLRDIHPNMTTSLNRYYLNGHSVHPIITINA